MSILCGMKKYGHPKTFLVLIVLLAFVSSCKVISNSSRVNPDGSLTVTSHVNGRECQKTFGAGEWTQVGPQFRINGVPVETIDVCQ